MTSPILDCMRWLILTLLFLLDCFASAATYPMPPIVSRSAWGCPDGQDSPRDPPVPLAQPLTHIFVHHSDRSNSSSDWSAEVKDVWQKHTWPKLFGGMDWEDVGYNYLIDPNGVIYEGRAGGLHGAEIEGYHAFGYNRSMGVCLLGNFMDVPPSEKAMESLRQIIAWKCDQRGIDPASESVYPGKDTKKNISGHRDTNEFRTANGEETTECPGDVLYSMLPELRQDVADLLAAFHSFPKVRTLSADQVTATSIRFRGAIENAGNASITGRRFDYGSTTPLSEYAEVTLTNGNEFYYTITGLRPGTTIKFRAWARNSQGWSNGSILSATTTPSGDGVPPEIAEFKVSPRTIPLGGEVKISCIVSDSGGSGLNRVELWRATTGGGKGANWTMVQQKTVSGSEETSRSFTDVPNSSGGYWYGIHVVDGAGNLIDESDAGFDTQKVTVSDANSAKVVPQLFKIDDDAESGSSGNGDGLPNPGEHLEIDLDWRNLGTSDAEDCHCEIESDDPFVTIPDNDVNAGLIEAGETKSSGDFDVVISDACPDFHEIIFSVRTTWNGGEETGTYRMIVRRVPFAAFVDTPAQGQPVSFPISFKWRSLGSPPSSLRLVFWNGDPSKPVRSKSVQGTESIMSVQEWQANVAPSFPGSERFKWSLGFVDSGGVLRLLTPWSDFRPVIPASSVFSAVAPASGANLPFPATFSWNVQGPVPQNLRIVFSDRATQGKLVWKPVAETSTTVSADEWRFGVSPQLPPASVYYWSIGYQDEAGKLHALTALRPFSPSLPAAPSSSLVAPMAGVDLKFPATFKWSATGIGGKSLKLAFRSSAAPSRLRLRSVSGTEVVIVSDEWTNQVGVHLSASASYEWAVGFVDDEGRFQILTAWRSFQAVIEENFAQWALLHGLSGPDGLDDGDPDHDGIKNLLEYALGANPLVNSAASVPQLLRGSDSHVEFTFTRIPTRTDIDYRLQVSEDLGIWTTIARSDRGLPTSAAGADSVAITEVGSASLGVTVRKQIASSKVFLRLQILRN